MTNDDAIKWLENLKQDIDQLRYDVRCHYEQAIDEICGLLKEQEPVEPDKPEEVWLCGNCGEIVGWDDWIISTDDVRHNYCTRCGKAVKWDE